MRRESAAEILVLLARFAPHWSHIDPLREYAELCVRARTKNGIAARVGLVVHELLENAVKYGDPSTEVELTVHSRADGSAITVRVENRAHPSRTAILARELRRTAAEPSPEALLQALRRLPRLPEGASMLGLTRLSLESALDAQVDGDRVVFTARVETRGPTAKHA